MKNYKISEKRDRNLSILAHICAHPGDTLSDVGKPYGITKQRVSQILKRLNRQKHCENCVYILAGGHCFVRPDDDMQNPCLEWAPKQDYREIDGG